MRWWWTCAAMSTPSRRGTKLFFLPTLPVASTQVSRWAGVPRTARDRSDPERARGLDISPRLRAPRRRAPPKNFGGRRQAALRGPRQQRAESVRKALPGVRLLLGRGEQPARIEVPMRACAQRRMPRHRCSVSAFSAQAPPCAASPSFPLPRQPSLADRWSRPTTPVCLLEGEGRVASRGRCRLWSEERMPSPCRRAPAQAVPRAKNHERTPPRSAVHLA